MGFQCDPADAAFPNGSPAAAVGRGHGIAGTRVRDWSDPRKALVIPVLGSTGRARVDSLRARRSSYGATAAATELCPRSAAISGLVHLHLDPSRRRAPPEGAAEAIAQREDGREVVGAVDVGRGSGGTTGAPPPRASRRRGLEPRRQADVRYSTRFAITKNTSKQQRRTARRCPPRATPRCMSVSADRRARGAPPRIGLPDPQQIAKTMTNATAARTAAISAANARQWRALAGDARHVPVV